jgi:DNA repair exonuclease SbcCD nuclease subunit
MKDKNRAEVRITLCGDIVHQKIVISNEQLMLASQFINQLSLIAPVVMIAGNHDTLENNKDRIDSLTPIISFLNGKEITYFKESKCSLDENIVWCPYSVFEGNIRPNIEEAKTLHGSDKTYIGLFHAPIIGSTTDIGFKFEHGAELSLFDGLDCVMLGDIHKHQEFRFGKTIAAYSSSLIQQDYGEKITKHGYLLWDLTNKDNINYKMVEIPNNNGFYKFEINSLSDIDNGTEKLLNYD